MMYLASPYSHPEVVVREQRFHDGWRESVGVAAEIRIAGELSNPVRYLAQDATGSPTLRRRQDVEETYDQ